MIYAGSVQPRRPEEPKSLENSMQSIDRQAFNPASVWGKAFWRDGFIANSQVMHRPSFGLNSFESGDCILPVLCKASILSVLLNLDSS